MSATPRQIPDSECKQGKCAFSTTGCWDECNMKRFPLMYSASGAPTVQFAYLPSQPVAAAKAAALLSTEQIACMGFDAFRILQGLPPKTYTAEQICAALTGRA